MEWEPYHDFMTADGVWEERGNMVRAALASGI